MACDKLFKEALEDTLRSTNPELREQLSKERLKPSGYEPKPGRGIDFTSEVAINKQVEKTK